MTTQSHKTSDIIEDIIRDCDDDGIITLEQFLERLGRRVHAVAILVLALSAVVAGIVPGFSTITAIPIMFISLQMMLERRAIWLPKQVREKTLSPRIIHGALTRSVAPLKRIETFLKPRLLPLTSPLAQRFLGLLIFVLAGILSLPIPAGNFLPSMAISLMALAILERDGLLVLGVGLMVALTGGLMIELIVQAGHYTSSFFHWLF
jgi:hypothetical protein